MLNRSLFTFILVTSLVTSVTANNSIDQETANSDTLESVTELFGQDQVVNQNKNTEDLITLTPEEAQSIAFMLKDCDTDYVKGLLLMFAASGYCVCNNLLTISTSHNFTQGTVEVLLLTALMVQFFWFGKKLGERGKRKIELGWELVRKMRTKNINPLPNTLTNNMLNVFDFLRFTSLL